MLGMAYIRVLEVATFYTQFLLKPVGTQAHILVCGTTPCMLRGAEDIRAICQHRISHEPFETNAAGTLSWEEVECVGACVNAPVVMIGNDAYEDLTVESFNLLLDKFEAGKGDEVKPGPQVERQFSAAEGGQTTLLEKPTAERTYMPFPPPATPRACSGCRSGARGCRQAGGGSEDTGTLARADQARPPAQGDRGSGSGPQAAQGARARSRTRRRKTLAPR